MSPENNTTFNQKRCEMKPTSSSSPAAERLEATSAERRIRFKEKVKRKALMARHSSSAADGNVGEGPTIGVPPRRQLSSSRLQEAFSSAGASSASTCTRVTPVCSRASVCTRGTSIGPSIHLDAPSRPKASNEVLALTRGPLRNTQGRHRVPCSKKAQERHRGPSSKPSLRACKSRTFQELLDQEFQSSSVKIVKSSVSGQPSQEVKHSSSKTKPSGHGSRVSQKLLDSKLQWTQFIDVLSTREGRGYGHRPSAVRKARKLLIDPEISFVFSSRYQQHEN
ncbi:unnamed protein product [Cyprideis torosa]|uniref:Uncharacterized protein n=1 Tax=Cyprideis torosa TaxID=163714 RepID=A0A7R8ZKV3_9CRUS|nr:unnamed protein product [Cyprideis torosa]CAG0885172.1 unnamed protein product [Cyprideis torosa]